MNYTLLQDTTDPHTWVRQVRVMAGKPEDLTYPIPSHAVTRRYTDELNLFHMDASWPLREVVRMKHPNCDEKFFQNTLWTIAAWWIGDQQVSMAMLDAGAAFSNAIMVTPQIALIQHIPSNKTEFMNHKGICLVQADWVLDGFLVVTAGGMWSGQPIYKKVGSQLKPFTHERDS